MDKLRLEVSWGTLWQIFLFVLLVGVLFIARDIVFGLFLAIVISSGLEVAVTFLERRGVPRTLGVILLFLVMALLLAVTVYFLVPLLIEEVNEVFKTARTSPLGAFVNQFLDAPTARSFTQILNEFAQELFSGNLTPFGALSKIFGGFGLAAAVIVSSFYLSLSRDGVGRFIRVVFPETHEEKALKIYERSRLKIGRWFQSQILLSVVMGVLSWGALSLLGVPHAFLIGVLAGILEIVPFVGPIIYGGVAILFAFTVSSALAIYTLLAFLLLQQFESHVLVPLIMRKVVDLHPVIVITVLFIGIKVGGVLGALLSVPFAAILQEVIEERSSRKGEPAVVEP